MAGIAPQQPDPSQQDPQTPGPSQSPDAQPQQGPDEIGDEEGLQPNVSPDEQKAYEEFVLAGMMLLYQKTDPKAQPQVRPGILKLLDNDPTDLKAALKIPELDKQFSPLVAIAATAALIVVEIVKLAGSVDKPSDDVIMHGGVAILEELCEIWMRRNKQQLGEDDVHKALSMAADIYREVAADQGLIDLNSLKDQFAELVKADKSGDLASVSPDLAGINKAAEINAQQGDDTSQPPDDQAQPPDPSADQQQEPPQ